MGSFRAGVTGFGSALVAMPLLALLLEVRAAAALVALPWRPVAPLLAGSLAGIPASVLLLASADARLARALLGAVLIAASAALLGARGLRIGPGAGPALAAGAFAGLLGGAFNANGPVAALYAAARGWEKRETHAALQLYFLASGIAVAALHGAAGFTDRGVLLATAISLPALALGAVAGWVVHRRIDEDRYRRVLLLVLLAAGGAMVAVAAQG